MHINKLYQLLGQIAYSYGRIDFLISNLAVDLGLAKSYQDFFAQTSFAKKISDIKEKGVQDITSDDLRIELTNLMDLLEEFRLARNTLMHSIILANKDDFLLYNFNKRGKEIGRNVSHYSSAQIETLVDNSIQLHNDIYVFRKKIIPNLKWPVN